MKLEQVVEQEDHHEQAERPECVTGPPSARESTGVRYTEQGDDSHRPTEHTERGDETAVPVASTDCRSVEQERFDRDRRLKSNYCQTTDPEQPCDQEPLQGRRPLSGSPTSSTFVNSLSSLHT